MLQCDLRCESELVSSSTELASTVIDQTKIKDAWMLHPVVVHRLAESADMQPCFVTKLLLTTCTITDASEDAVYMIAVMLAASA